MDRRRPVRGNPPAELTSAVDPGSGASSRRPRLARLLSVAVWGEGISRAAAFAAGLAVAWSTSTPDFGRFSFVLALIGIGLTLADVGLQTSATRLITQDVEHAARHAGAAVALGLSAAAFAYLGIATAAVVGLLPAETTTPALIYGVVVFLSAPLNALWSVLRGIGRADLVYALYAGGALALLALVVGAVSVSTSLELIFGCYAGAFCLRLVATWLVVRRVHNRPLQVPSRGEVRTIAVATQVVAAAFLLLNVYSHIDTVLLGFLVDARAVGEYAAAYRLVDGLTFLSAGAATTVLFPLIVRSLQSSRERTGEVLSAAIRLLTMVLVPACIALGVGSSLLLRILFHITADRARDVLLILAVASFLVALNFFLVFAALAVNLDRIVVQGTGVAAAVNIATNLVFVPTLGLRAAAFATLLAETLLLVWLAVSFATSGIRLRMEAPVSMGVALVTAPLGVAYVWPDYTSVAVGAVAVAGAVALAAGVRRGSWASVTSLLREEGV